MDDDDEEKMMLETMRPALNNDFVKNHQYPSLYSKF
jgi:hypothetical protein